jgi:two-component system sensor kinase FixL
LFFRVTQVTRYVVAVASVVASLGLRAVLTPVLGDNVPFLLFFPAILLASWYGGFWPGTVATLGSAAAVLVTFLNRTSVLPASDVLQLALFLLIGTAIASLSGRLAEAHTDVRKEAALARGRAERLDAIINTTVDGIIVIDSRGLVEAFNPGAERLFGYAAAEVIGRNVNMLMPSPYHEEHDNYVSRFLSTGDRKIIGIGREVKGRRKDGTAFPLHLSVGEMTVAGERKFTGMLHDLSDRVQLEERLRASEERWRSVIESAVDSIIVIDARGQVESINPAALRLFGYGAEEVIGRNVSMLMPSPYHEEHDSYLARYLSTGERKIIGIGREVTGRRKDGGTFPLHLSVGEMLTRSGERKFTGILHDLSSRVALEEQLRERGALAKLGEMAAMIAHEVKNPLAGMRGAVQVIGSRMPPENPDKPMMQEIVRRIDSLDAMMKDLLLFARPPQPKRSPTDVMPLLAATAGLLREDEGAKQVEVKIEGQAPLVAADGEMLKMVFHNLLINGAHAMHGRGTIRVQVSAADRALRVAVSDQGPGIPADVRDKIFTPFFTTKRRGTGLGLPTARRFIEAHDGRITVDCPPSGGTTVTVQLPLA